MSAPLWFLISSAAAADPGSFVARETSIVERLVSFVGIFAFAAMCWAMSEKRSAVRWRPIAWGIALQIALCSIVLIPGLSGSLVLMSDAVGKLLGFSGQGATFVFQSVEPHTVTTGSIPDLLAGKGTDQLFIGSVSPPVKTFAFWILPTIVFFSALSNVLYHFGVLQLVVKGIAWVMVRTMGTSGAETLCTAGNIFLGQTEAPLLVKPFLDRMTRSEVMVVMVGGFSTIAVGVLGAYAGFLHMVPNIGGHLVIASIISAPATFVCAKLIVPETGTPETGGTAALVLPKGEGNLLQAIAIGASDGMRLAINVAAMLIAIVALVAMVNFAISWVPVTVCDGGGFAAGYTCGGGGRPLDLSTILGWLFFPFALLMGVPWDEAGAVGRLLGEKLVLTEFVAYINLGSMLEAGKPPVLSERSAIIAAYAICGFANFASIGIQVGGIGAVAPNKAGDLASLGFKAMIAGAIATCMTGAVVGLFV